MACVTNLTTLPDRARSGLATQFDTAELRPPSVVLEQSETTEVDLTFARRFDSELERLICGGNIANKKCLIRRQFDE
jgi:hypothetical protein